MIIGCDGNTKQNEINIFQTENKKNWFRRLWTLKVLWREEENAPTSNAIMRCSFCLCWINSSRPKQWWNFSLLKTPVSMKIYTKKHFFISFQSLRCKLKLSKWQSEKLPQRFLLVRLFLVFSDLENKLILISTINLDDLKILVVRRVGHKYIGMKEQNAHPLSFLHIHRCKAKRFNIMTVKYKLYFLYISITTTKHA